jgi:hypothetical protein
MQIFAVVDLSCSLQHAQTGEDADRRQCGTNGVSHTVASTSKAGNIIGIFGSIDVTFVYFLSDKFRQQNTSSSTSESIEEHVIGCHIGGPKDFANNEDLYGREKFRVRQSVQ